ncbi:Cell division control protein 73 [Smittium mucronatum]|uniref:Cell division control protein 73 n=1 Tax=Smittium mucronatum TaxID=133383 RepID=A0A1R0H1R0_9FUNG|nr:Cell division control protein 73 [Smittium mucronatum]
MVNENSDILEDGPNPIHELRALIIKKKKYILLDENKIETSNFIHCKFVNLGGSLFDPNVPTNYYHGPKPQDFYSLIAILFFWFHRDAGYYSYLKSAQDAKLSAVSFTCRTDLIDFLSGNKDSSPNLKSPEEIEKILSEKDSLIDDIDSEQIKNTQSEILKQERLIISNNSIISSNKSFKHVIDIADNILKRVLETNTMHIPSDPSLSGPSSDFANTDPKSSKRIKKRAAVPIIIVPAAATSLINMYNVTEFLRDQKKNIVCVFTVGASWQFSNWHWSSPKEVFENCLGLYPKYVDEKIKDSVKGWNIYPVNIERHKRHTDKAITIELWKHIEKYISLKKPWLTASNP